MNNYRMGPACLCCIRPENVLDYRVWTTFLNMIIKRGYEPSIFAEGYLPRLQTHSHVAVKPDQQ